MKRAIKLNLGLGLLIMIAGCNLIGTPEPELALETQGETLTIGAENFKAHSGKSHSWKLKKDKAGAVFQALPDSGKNYKKDYRSASPRLDTTLDLPAGTYYVWVRGRAIPGKQGSSNSLHLGLDGEPKAEHISGFESELSWTNRTMKGSRVKLSVPKGKHTLNVWMREDGFTLDKLWLTRNPDESPGTSPSRGPSLSGKGVQAKRADSFVDSIGVNTHLHFDDTVYKKFDSLIGPKLVKLGVRHLRDGAYTSKGHGENHFYYKRCRSLAKEGIRFNMLVNVKTSYTKGTDFSKLDDIYGWCDGAIVSFEGLNEPDLRGQSNWADVTRDVQKKLYRAVNSDSELNQVKVLGPSVTWKTSKVGNLSRYLDYGNWHPYAGGKCPSCRDPYGNGLDSNLAKHRKPSGDKPMIMTETGYHNAVNVGKADHRPVSEKASATYIPRLFFEHFNRGFVRSYLYEFIDLKSDPERNERDKNFGLLRHDGSEKPAYKALENLISLLEDPKANFEPGKLDYALGGEMSKIHSTLLQKGNGTFYLALWQARSSYDTGARANAPDNLKARGDINVPKQKVTLTLGTPLDKATLYTLSDTGSMSKKAASLKGGRLELSVGDTVTLVELRP